MRLLLSNHETDKRVDQSPKILDQSRTLEKWRR